MNVKIKKWSKILKIISGKNQKMVNNPQGKYPIYGSGGVIGRADEYLCEAGTTIIGRKGTINSPIFVNERFWNVDTAFGLCPGDELIPKYLYFFCVLYNFNKLDKSTTIPSLAKRDLLNIEMFVPPLPEQERIVSQIEELFSQLDKVVDMLKSIKQQLVTYRQSVLKEAFEGKWKFKQRTDIPTTVYFKNVNENELTVLKKLPSEWRYVYLSDLGDLSRGRSKHRPRNDAQLFENGKYPFFQTGDVKSAKKELFESEKLYGDFGLQQSRLWPAGTLCITIAANIAETCFLGVDGCFPDSIVGFTPNSKLVDKDYVRFFIEASKLRLWAFAPATAQKNINLATLENLIIPYCTLEEQHYIVQEIEARLSVCDSIEKTVDDILKQTDVMRKSILKDAFERRLY